MDTHLHGADVAHDVLNFILDTCQTLDMLKKVEQMEMERKEENDGDNKHGSDTDDSEEENKEKTSKKKKTPASESHHINHKCLVRQCHGYEGPNLCPHLVNVHCRKGHITPKVVGKFFAMGLKLRGKRGPKRAERRTLVKGRARRWCPEEGCDYLGCYLPTTYKTNTA